MISFCIIKNDYNLTKEIVFNLKNDLEKKGWLYDEQNPKYIFIFGGDGTFLKAVSNYKEKIKNIILVPFKLGGVGFYTNKNCINKIDKTINSIENNDYSICEFEMLEIKTQSRNYVATNEIKILNEKNPLYIEIFINDEFLEKFHGTGLVVSTSNGSTGYMKSAGGAVIFPGNSKIFELQELVPVSTNRFRTLNAPLILDSKNILKLKLEQNSKELLIIDTVDYLIDDPEIEIKPLEWNIKVLCEHKVASKIDILRDIFIKDKDIIK